ncbi:MAG TPA: tetratricopeptide repeat protein [Vicinamibacterales bacterium]|nr:tetratricopeptide repeat protein [Vicinamibacterales bacterium]
MLIGLAALVATIGSASAQPNADPFVVPRDAKASVIVFTTIDCPISNRYAPEISRLQAEFERQGVRFWLVFPNPADTPQAIDEHVKRFGYHMPVLRDREQSLVKRAGVSIAPEAAVVDKKGRVVYHGRIDDRYVSFGVERPTPTRRDLREAISDLLADRPVRVSVTQAIGCVLADFVPPPPTFAKDVAPVIFEVCGSCHRQGGPAPFSLLTYEAVRQHASQIVDVTKTRFMPPWKADAQDGPFVGQRRLGDDELAMIERWVAAGSPMGDAEDLPRAAARTDSWQLGTPDLVVTIPEAFRLSAESTDVFRIFAIPLAIDSVRYVRGIEFLPGNSRVVHHANIRLDYSAATRQLDAADPAPGYDGLMPRSAVYPEGHFLGWTPGQIAPLVPAKFAWVLKPGADLVVQLHMQPTGAPELVKPAIGFYFSKEPPTRMPAILRLGSQGIDIPPGDATYTIRDSYVLPIDVELQALQPHAHYRARDVRGSAVLPDGTIRPLIHIRDWDFRWQHVYRYETPVVLPKGTKLTMEYTYDNSELNPRNPDRPVRRVLWGQRTADEMGDLWFQLLPRHGEDLATLNAQTERKMMLEDVIGYETMLRASPADAELHDDVALLYLNLGRAREAAEHFRASTRLKPASAAAHFNLATALSVQGLLEEATAEYEEALAREPSYASAHNNLGSVLSVSGRSFDAIQHFREAARLDPGNVQAQANLAREVAAIVRRFLILGS